MYENRKAFKRMIGCCEGTVTHALTKDDGYDVIVTGIKQTDTHVLRTPEVFTDYRYHPFAVGENAALWRAPKVINLNGLESTASGRYQILRKYWLIYAKQLGLRDFGPASQEAYVEQQFRERKALALIDGGYLESAVLAVAGLWASMPGKGYKDQPQHTFDRCRQFYLESGGTINS